MGVPLGITQSRTRARGRALAILAAIVAVLAVAAALAAPAGAASEATFDDIVDGSYATVRGDLGTFAAGLMGMTVDGSSTTGYCIDIGTEIQPGESGLDEVDWDTSGVQNLDTVAGILAAYAPNGTGPAGFEITGSAAQQAAATQAAIWHFTDGFDLTVGDNDPVIEANYAAILAAVEAGALPTSGQPDVSLSITPPASVEGEAGHLVGPFVVSTTASEVTLTPSAGVTVTDASGNPLTGPVVDGTEFFLTSSAAGAGTVTASAQATVHSGRVFVKEGSQRLILAAPVEAQIDAQAGGSWTTPPTTTPPTTTPPTTTPPTTTPPETTTTTAPPGTTTTEPQAESTTTTVAITPNPSIVPPAPVESTPTTVATSDSLPRTGQDLQPLIAVGLGLLAAGLGLGVATRRRRS